MSTQACTLAFGGQKTTWGVALQELSILSLRLRVLHLDPGLAYSAGLVSHWARGFFYVHLPSIGTALRLPIQLI